MKGNKIYRRIRTVQWRWKQLEYFKQGHLDLKMAYIEEKKAYKNFMLCKYMIYEQELLRKVFEALKSNARIDKKRELKNRVTELKIEESSDNNDVSNVNVKNKKGYEQIKKTIKSVTNGGRNKARVLTTVKERLESSSDDEPPIKLS